MCCNSAELEAKTEAYSASHDVVFSHCPPRQNSGVDPMARSKVS
jgi:hypothetical protein